ncbi:hypothetical protein [Pedobacter sp. BAL39]|uniref:hypothetical protein n=1 Tax=Pedobacter sp. BAL39 TaxID=391596 RepID=UPI0012F716CA|nr:hypothetical protein [Pedobacter sp. BAL39]
MKKLSNVSPFLLLLVPVFVMMMLSLAASTVNTPSDEVALKGNTKTTGIAKITSIFFK